MSKSLILNFEVLKEQEITVPELLQLYNLYVDEMVVTSCGVMDVDKLESKLFIKKIDNKIYLREKAIKLIEFLSIETEGSFDTKKVKKTKSKRVILSVVEDNVVEFRNKWRGLKPGSMGSLKACKEKLHRWMKENPEYTFEQILKAADLYLATEGANIRYLQRADYFVFKQDANRDEMSRLSAFIDDIDENSSGDWTTNLN